MSWPAERRDDTARPTPRRVSPAMPQDEREPAQPWVVWRQDDNGNRFEVRRCATREQAETLAAEFEARGHKQLYWVAERT
ncbi:hypothetical protein [Catellatospora sp. NPDC049609]|uniref:hypothetical protein n=1 Tax=Catellatospora sp. NPDC049609 TaxID=3155505 RepID=UPI00343B7624